METLTRKITDKIIEKIKKAAVELEEFELQFALGKAEAADKYEEIKKEWIETVRNIRNELKEPGIIKKIDRLLDMLHSDRVELKEVFEKQRKEILQLLEDIMDDLKKSKISESIYMLFASDIEKFKIKMEILRLKFALKKMDWKEEWEERKKEFNKKMDEFSQRMHDQKNSTKENREEFFNELSKAYLHLRKAFTK